MSRIDDIFRRLRREGRTALMPFITAGHPTPAVTRAVLPMLEQAGASAVEIGIPFSDPIADGPVIAASMHEALQSGTTPDSVFALVEMVRPRLQMGLIAMVSNSIVHRIGTERFLARAAAAGFDGVIVPDIDLVTAPAVRQAADDVGVSFSLLVAPTTTEERLHEIAALATGFIYLMARVGITGESTEVPRIAERVEAVRAVTTLPIAVGFGISSARHVAAVTAVADAAIVGSALVRRMGESAAPAEDARDFVADLAGGLATRQPASEQR